MPQPLLRFAAEYDGNHDGPLLTHEAALISSAISLASLLRPKLHITISHQGPMIYIRKA
jgi:hypothetical protein